MKKVILSLLFCVVAATASAGDKKTPSESFQEFVKATLTKLHKVDKKLILSISKDKKDAQNRLSRYKGIVSKRGLEKVKKGQFDKSLAAQFKAQKGKDSITIRLNLLAYDIHNLVLTFKPTPKNKKAPWTLTKVSQEGW